jgi:hypothetical protein
LDSNFVNIFSHIQKKKDKKIKQENTYLRLTIKIFNYQSEKMKKPAIRKILLIVAICVLIVLASYGGYRAVEDYMLSREQAAYNAGFNDGITRSVLSVFQNVQANGYVTLNYGNATLTLVPYIPQTNQSR